MQDLWRQLSDRRHWKNIVWHKFLLILVWQKQACREYLLQVEKIPPEQEQPASANPKMAYRQTATCDQEYSKVSAEQQKTTALREQMEQQETWE